MFEAIFRFCVKLFKIGFCVWILFPVALFLLIILGTILGFGG
uniref:Uncharacterized protein n=2 Tax=unclassified Microvirus TaxID=338099 RepID=A0AAU8AX85_9VIRU